MRVFYYTGGPTTRAHLLNRLRRHAGRTSSYAARPRQDCGEGSPISFHDRALAESCSVKDREGGHRSADSHSGRSSCAHLCGFVRAGLRAMMLGVRSNNTHGRRSGPEVDRERMIVGERWRRCGLASHMRNNMSARLIYAQIAEKSCATAHLPRCLHARQVRCLRRACGVISRLTSHHPIRTGSLSLVLTSSHSTLNLPTSER